MHLRVEFLNNKLSDYYFVYKITFPLSQSNLEHILFMLCKVYPRTVSTALFPSQLNELSDSLTATRINNTDDANICV